jgi:GTP cyclohydrolase II
VNETSAALQQVFADEAQIAVDRAVVELRAGRPILLEEAGPGRLIAAIDSMTPAVFGALVAGKGARLVLTAARARTLGLVADWPIAVDLAGMGQETALRLAGGTDSIIPRNWVAADAAARAALELCKQALLLPAAIMATAGATKEMLLPILRLPLASLEGLARRERHNLEIVSRARVPLAASAETSFVVFRGGPGLRDQVAIVVGDPNPARPVLLRLHSACLTGDLFGSIRCDCGDQLRKAVGAIAAEGGGVLLYLDQEGRGTGIRNKMRAYALQDAGFDTIDADAILGFGADERRYEIAAAMLQKLGFHRVRLLTNNPSRVEALARAGIEVVGRRPLVGAVTTENLPYLTAKVRRAGHLLEEEDRALPRAESA